MVPSARRVTIVTSGDLRTRRGEKVTHSLIVIQVVTFSHNVTTILVTPRAENQE